MTESGRAKLHVVSPGGRDPDRDFSLGAGSPADPGHPPINYHAYAACTGGMFVCSLTSLPADARSVLLLVRPKHLGRTMKTLCELRGRGAVVYISLKESGLQQVASAFSDPPRWTQFVELASAADGFFSSTEDLPSFYRAAGCSGGGFIPTPYPIRENAWDFGRPLNERRGIFIGTREFDVPSRNHLLALAAAAGLGAPITVINTQGGRGERMIRAVSPAINVVRGPLPYPDYLQLMASHRIVFQYDQGRVPGQVAGDALLCRMPCVGGDSTIERLAFGGLHSHGKTLQDCLAQAENLLADAAAWQAQVEASRVAAEHHLSFQAVANKILKFIA